MANINIVVDKPISDGSKLKFRTPCESTAIEGLEVKYPAKNGVGTLIKKFVFKDAHGTELSGVGNLFVRNVMIEVLLDVTHGVAYIKNADTNSYVENAIRRLEESHKQFWDVASKAVDAAVVRADSVQGIYIGSGKMKEGYSVQIDPDGDCVTVDKQLDETSESPVANRVVKAAIDMVHSSSVQRDKGIEDSIKGVSDRVADLENKGLEAQIGYVAGNLTALKDKANKTLFNGDQPVSNLSNLVVEELKKYRLFAFRLAQTTAVEYEYVNEGVLLLYAVEKSDWSGYYAYASVITEEGVTYKLKVNFDFTNNKISVQSFSSDSNSDKVVISEIIGIA